MLLGTRQGGVLDVCPHNLNGSAGDISKRVQRWNEWARLSTRNEWKNYRDGYRKLLYEFTGSGGQGNTNGSAIYILAAPIKGAFTKIASRMEIEGKVRDFLAKKVGSYSGVVVRWDGRPLFVDQIEIVNKIEEFVPSRFTVGCQVNERLEEGSGHPLGESILYGFLKPCSAFAKGKLDFSSFGIRGGERSNDFPVSMIERGSEVMDYIGGDESGVQYDGFVSFYKNGTLSGLHIGFEDKAKGSLFAEQLVKLIDVFRSPIEFS